MSGSGPFEDPDPFDWTVTMQTLWAAEHKRALADSIVGIPVMTTDALPKGEIRMAKLPRPVFVKCERCGHDRAGHYSANLTDGEVVGLYLLICPTAIFKAKGFDASGTPYKDGNWVYRQEKR